MITLLFDMITRCEEYVYRMLLRTKEDNLEVSFQNKQVFWEGRTIRPDLVLIKTDGNNEEETFIIDTKWKVLDVTNPKPSDNDLKQMYAYNLYWDAKRSMLLYPNSKNITEKFGNYWKGRIDPDDNQCKVGFINVLDEKNDLNLDIGVQILDKLY